MTDSLLRILVLAIAFTTGPGGTSRAFGPSRTAATTSVADPEMKQMVRAAIDRFMAVNDGDGKEHVLRDLGEYGEAAAEAVPIVVKWYKERRSRGDPVTPEPAAHIGHFGPAVDPFVNELAQAGGALDPSVAFEIAIVRWTFSAEWFRDLLSKSDDFDPLIDPETGDRTLEARIGYVARFSRLPPALRPNGDEIPETVAHFRETMDGGDANLSIMSAASLISLRSSRAEVLATLRRHALSPEDPVMAASAGTLAWAVDTYGDDIVPDLKAFFASNARARQVAAFAVMGSKHDSVAIRHLIAEHANDPDAKVRELIQEALELRKKAKGPTPP